jgi:hypothetical protein
MARPIDKEQVGAAGKPVAEGEHLIDEIAAGAMQENDRRKVGVSMRGFQHDSAAVCR